MSRLLLLAVLGGVAASCVPPSPDADASVDAGLEPDASVDAGPDAGTDAGADGGQDAGVQAPDSAAGRQLAWILSVLNGGLPGTTNAQLSAHFTPAFLAAVPVTQLRAVFGQFAATAPWTLVGFDGTPGANRLTALVTDSSGQYQRIIVQTDPAQGDKIGGLLFTSGADVDPSLDTWAEVEPALRAVAPSVTYLEADVASGTCVEQRAIAPQTSVALGSAFKLYVLATLAQEIDAGVHAWTDTVAIRDDWKSLPSGTWQNDPIGTTHTLRAYADQMISVSDNTATDHLLLTVGRPQVEAMVAQTGHHDPTLDQPFLTTRELFTLKLMLSPAEQQAYVAATVADKRTQLAGYGTSRDPRAFSGSWTTPKLIDQVEWFASPQDLCKAMLTLKAYGSTPATAQVLDVLSINPGIADPTGAFSYVGFKGGSEPGVLTLTWLLQRAGDHGWRVVSVAFNDTQAVIDESRAIYVAAAARALAGR